MSKERELLRLYREHMYYHLNARRSIEADETVTANRYTKQMLETRELIKELELPEEEDQLN